ESHWIPLIQSSALRGRIGFAGEGALPSKADSETLVGRSPEAFSGSETATKHPESEPFADSRAGNSGDHMFDLLSARPARHRGGGWVMSVRCEVVGGSGDVEGQFLQLVARLSSSLSPRQWHHKAVPGPLAQGYELA